MNSTNSILEHLEFLYGPDVAGPTFKRLQARLAEFRQANPQLAERPTPPAERVTQADSMLITYADQITEPGRPALQTLGQFLARHLTGVASTVHLLPFFPYSSDDGFSVIDYKAVNPDFGDWPDLQPLRRRFRLMFDAVINHISAHSDWFRGFLAGDPRYADYFIVTDPAADLSGVTRPRTLPLLTPVQAAGGTRHVWTTFSPDQIDLNYKSPDVLLEIIDVLLFYAARGADFIRLDAIGFMWKEIGTSCIHLPQTHRAIQLLRAVLDQVAPNVLLITETNVPHAENVAYFGNGRNEAQLVYNFSLAPLVLHTFYTENAAALQAWAAGLETLPDTATFFNFIASHDGIGVRPAEGILTLAEIQHLADKTTAHGGYVSTKTNPDGSQSPYELNITLFDALSDPASTEPPALKIDRFIASQAIMLALAGMPGIYVHSLFGSANDHAGVAQTGRARSINRQKWRLAQIEAALANPRSRAAQVFHRYRRLLVARAASPAFHPNGGQRILPGNPATFNLLRTSPDGAARVLCLHNITARPQRITVGLPEIIGPLRDLLSGKIVNATRGSVDVTLPAYAVRWLEFGLAAGGNTESD